MDEPDWRLFLAVWPPPDIRDALVRAGAGWRWPPTARRTRAERLHLTLHFIGERPASEVPGMVAALGLPCEPFELELRVPQLWASTAVLTAERTPPALAQLHAALGERLASMALPVDSRPFRPHVTLARQARGAQWPAASPVIRWRAEDGYRLVRSLPGGAGYETLARYGCGSR